MLDSLYEKALEKKDELNNKLEEGYRDLKKAHAKVWVDQLIEEKKTDMTICGGDGSRNWNEYLSCVVYAINSECLIYDGTTLQKIKCGDIDIINPYKYVKNRMDIYMGIYEIKNSLKAIKTFDIDLTLFDGSLLGKLITPSSLEYSLPKRIKDELKSKYLPQIETSWNNNEEVKIQTSELHNLVEQDFKGYESESVIYLENLEYLSALKNLLTETKDIIGVSKTSTSTEYFNKIPDMAVFDRYSKKQGYSKPIHIKMSEKAVKRAFPIYDHIFKKFTFTIFYARFDDFKNILKFELPYKADEEEIITILESLKGICTDGYPYLLKKAHNDVVVRKIDVERISRMMGISEKLGRDGLWLK